MLAGVFVVMQLVVFGVKQMDPGMGVMKAADLLLQGNELIPFFGIAGDGKIFSGNRKSRTRDLELRAEDCREMG